MLRHTYDVLRPAISQFQPTPLVPATQCDLDHRIEWAKQHHTNTHDLGPFCRHDHIGRHKHGWTYRKLPNGDIEWTSPLGHTCTVKARGP